MNIKLSTVMALLVAGAFPALSLYAWQTQGTGLTEDEMAVNIAVNFLKNAPTYKFDGIPGTIEVVDTLILESYPVQYVVVMTFDCSHAGYGDRTGQVLAQVITSHTARVKVVQNEVVSSVLDGRWDELNQVETGQGEEEPQPTIHPPEFGRDTAIRFILLKHGELKGLEAPSSWEEKDLTPAGLVGAAKLQYTAEGWTVNVSWPVVWRPTYTVEIDFAGDGGFQWEGTVDQAGAVTETAFKLKG